MQMPVYNSNLICSSEADADRSVDARCFYPWELGVGSCDKKSGIWIQDQQYKSRELGSNRQAWLGLHSMRNISPKINGG